MKTVCIIALFISTLGFAGAMAQPTGMIQTQPAGVIQFPNQAKPDMSVVPKTLSLPPMSVPEPPDCEKMQADNQEMCSHNSTMNCSSANLLYKNCLAYKQAMEKCAGRGNDVTQGCAQPATPNDPPFDKAKCDLASNAYSECMKANTPVLSTAPAAQ